MKFANLAVDAAGLSCYTVNLVSIWKTQVFLNTSGDNLNRAMHRKSANLS